MIHLLETETTVRTLFEVFCWERKTWSIISCQSFQMLSAVKASELCCYTIPTPVCSSSCWLLTLCCYRHYSQFVQGCQCFPKLGTRVFWIHTVGTVLVLLAFFSFAGPNKHNLPFCFKVNRIDTFCLQPFKFVFLFLEMNQQRNYRARIALSYWVSGLDIFMSEKSSSFFSFYSYSIYNYI